MKPSIENVIHIPFIKYNNYIESKYKIPSITLKRNTGNRKVNYYDLGLVDSHMFRGNDSSKNFYNQFMNETIDSNILNHFNFLNVKILDILKNDQLSAKEINNQIILIPENEWIEAYIEVINNTQSIIQSLNEDEVYWLEYMICGLFESAVVSSYQITDLSENINKYFWYICW